MTRSRYYLLTWHGWFLGAGDGRPVPLGSAPEGADLLALDLPDGWDATAFLAFIALRPQESHEVDMEGLGRFVARRGPGGIGVTLSREGRFLAAEPDGRLPCDREAASGWETFLLVSEADLAFLRGLLRGHHVVGSTAKVAGPGDWKVRPGPALAFGEAEFPLAHNLPFDLRSAPHRVLAYRDGWKLDQIHLFAPLVYSVAFGSNALAQLRIMLQSLIEIGRYDGHIHVFTDVGAETLRAWLPPHAGGRLTASPVPAEDWVGYVAAKYAILEHAPAFAHAPVAFMDPDVVFNGPATPMLVDMALAGRLSAPLEDFSPLATSPSVGSHLFHLANEEPRLACGVNLGTLGVPNLLEFGQHLDVIRRTIRNFLAIHHRGAMRFMDQEAGNYAMFKYGGFATARMSRYVTYGHVWDSEAVRRRDGLIHFWRIPRDERASCMERYLDLLRAADR